MNTTARAFESLLGFWAEAGVDACYRDAPVDRTVAAAQRAPARQPAKPLALALASFPAEAASQAAETASQLEAARHAAAGAADLAALELAIAAFDGCPLKTAGARRYVFARGNPQGPVMIIGEAPGGDEDIQGAPFVGRAGKLLDRMLAAVGLEGRVFITNTVFWRPPGNRTPTTVEQSVCQPFLERSIALVAPKALLLVGGAAAKSVLGQSEGILALRGRWVDWRASDGGPVIPALPTLHPAFLLRQPAAKKKAWQDMQALTVRLEATYGPG